MNSNVFFNMSYGVYVITTMDGERPTGCVANSLMQITSSPATVALSMNHDNYTHSCIEKSGKFGVSILSVNVDPQIIGKFGYFSGKDTNKFENISHEMKDGLPILTECCGYLVCKVIDKVETSTHTIFLAEVIDGDNAKDEIAMTYSYYHKVVKGKSPKNAPTYIAEEQKKKQQKLKTSAVFLIKLYSSFSDLYKNPDYLLWQLLFHLLHKEALR